MPSRTFWLWFFVASLGVTAVLGMMALLLPSIPFEEELFLSSALLAGYSLLGLMASIAIARCPIRAAAWAAVASLAISLAVWLVLIWGESAISWRTAETIARIGGSFTVLGVLPLHASLLLLASFERLLSRAVRVVTIVAACGAGLLLMSLFWGFWDSWYSDVGEWIGRLTGALAIPAALGTIAVPVLARIEFVSRRDGE